MYHTEEKGKKGEIRKGKLLCGSLPAVWFGAMTDQAQRAESVRETKMFLVARHFFCMYHTEEKGKIGELGKANFYVVVCHGVEEGCGGYIEIGHTTPCQIAAFTHSGC